MEVLVQYVEHATGAGRYRALVRNGKIKAAFEHIPVLHWEVNPEALAELEADPEVVSISPNRAVSAVLDHARASADFTPLDNYYTSIGRQRALGIGIAILDSGIQTSHPNFNSFLSNTSRIVYSQSFVGGDVNDEFGHGTHVAGIAAGMDNVTQLIANTRTSKYFGFAVDANIINLKVLNSAGAGTDASVIAAINQAIALKSKYNIRVMNLSLGRPVLASYKNDPLCQAVESAWKAGIVVVVAAGNSGRDNSQGTNGYGTITAPGNDPYVITVGASNDKGDNDITNDVIATYSSKGPTPIDHIVKPDLVAPGNRVVSYQSQGSALVTQYWTNQIPTSAYNPSGSSAYSPYFFTLSGTSMAAPVVSGIAAMLIDGNSAITPDQVKAKLMRTAWRGFPATMSTTLTDPLTGITTTNTATHDIFTVGAGQVDAWAAFNDKNLANGTALSPQATYDSTSKTLTVGNIPGSNAIWGSNLVWGSNIVWGSNAIWGNNIVWGSNLVWGSSLSSVAGFNMVWGSNLVWGSATPSADATPITILGEN